MIKNSVKNKFFLKRGKSISFNAVHELVVDMMRAASRRNGDGNLIRV
jgi:hypothetical protein